MKLTNDGENLHLSINGSIYVMALNSGFSYQNDEEILLINKDQAIACDKKEHKKFIKLYHKAIKPNHSGHYIWALTVSFIVSIVTFALLLLGLSQQVPVSNEVISTPPVLSVPKPALSEPALKTVEPNDFPFGNS